MAMVECIECGEKISDTAVVCPKCGAKQKKGKAGKFALIIVGVFAMLLVLMFALASTADPKKFQAREAIDECWKGQASKSLDPSSARFVAAVCEKMESDFRQRYGHAP